MTNPIDPNSTPRALLDGMAAAMGGLPALQAVHSVLAIADCTSPRGPYETEVQSLRGRRLFFRQSWPNRPALEVLIQGQQGWVIDRESGSRDELDPISTAMIRSHEFQMISLNFEAYFHDLRPAQAEPWQGSLHAKIEMTGELGETCAAYFDPQSGLLSGLVMPDMRQEGAVVQIVFAEWVPVDGVQLPVRVRAIDSDGEFVLDFHTLALNEVDESLFDENLFDDFQPEGRQE